MAAYFYSIILILGIIFGFSVISELVRGLLRIKITGTFLARSLYLAWLKVEGITVIILIYLVYQSFIGG